MWSNREFTCQHVDPHAPLGPFGRAVLEVKMLILQGSLDQVLERVKAQREGLRNENEPSLPNSTTVYSAREPFASR